MSLTIEAVKATLMPRGISSQGRPNLTICTFGTHAKPTSPTFFTFEQSDILSAIPTFGAWVATHTLGLPTAPTETATFCSTEPTGDLPLVTDWALLAFPPLAVFFGAYERLRNQVVAWKFSDVCECAPDPSGCTSQCDIVWSPTQAFTNFGGSGNYYSVCNTMQVSVAGSTFRGWYFWNLGASRAVWFNIWDSVTHLKVATQQYTCPTGLSYHPITSPFSLVNGRAYYVCYDLTLGSTQAEGSIAPPTPSWGAYTGHSFAVGLSLEPTTASGGWQPVEADVCWAGSPCNSGTPISPPVVAPVPTDFPAPPAGPTCASYQDICNELSVLFQQIESLQANVSIIRQTNVPEAAVYGAIHSGLTGHGIINVVGILGCSVTLTFVPATWGQTLETPRRLIPKAGTIQFSDGVHNTDEVQVHYDSQLVANAPTYTTEIVYNFRPGITGSITPLLISAPV